jgi:hypothetical protein
VIAIFAYNQLPHLTGDTTIHMVMALVGGKLKGSIPIADRMKMKGQRKSKQKRPTKPKKRGISTRLS